MVRSSGHGPSLMNVRGQLRRLQPTRRTLRVLTPRQALSEAATRRFSTVMAAMRGPTQDCTGSPSKQACWVYRPRPLARSRCRKTAYCHTATLSCRSKMEVSGFSKVEMSGSRYARRHVFGTSEHEFEGTRAPTSSARRRHWLRTPRTASPSTPPAGPSRCTSSGPSRRVKRAAGSSQGRA
jgi:hypothetical protein